MHAHRILAAVIGITLLAFGLACGGGQPQAPAATASAPNPDEHKIKPLAPVPCPAEAKIESMAAPGKMDVLKGDVVEWHCRKEPDCKGAAVIAVALQQKEADHIDELWTVNSKGTCYTYKVTLAGKESGVTDP
jgi:hypothetical protein